MTTVTITFGILMLASALAAWREAFRAAKDAQLARFEAQQAARLMRATGRVPVRLPVRQGPIPPPDEIPGENGERLIVKGFYEAPGGDPR